MSWPHYLFKILNDFAWMCAWDPVFRPKAAGESTCDRDWTTSPPDFPPRNAIIALYVCLNIVLVVCILAGFLLNVMGYERLSGVCWVAPTFWSTHHKPSIYLVKQSNLVNNLGHQPAFHWWNPYFFHRLLAVVTPNLAKWLGARGRPRLPFDDRAHGMPMTIPPPIVHPIHERYI